MATFFPYPLNLESVAFVDGVFFLTHQASIGTLKLPGYTLYLTHVSRTALGLASKPFVVAIPDEWVLTPWECRTHRLYGRLWLDSNTGYSVLSVKRQGMLSLEERRSTISNSESRTRLIITGIVERVSPEPLSPDDVYENMYRIFFLRTTGSNPRVLYRITENDFYERFEVHLISGNIVTVEALIVGYHTPEAYWIAEVQNVFTTTQ